MYSVTLGLFRATSHSGKSIIVKYSDNVFEVRVIAVNDKTMYI